ncbi:DEAD/DEAH box helicase [Xiamenia xianingshaonis]|uniref:DEAD/DEAH box helicase n=1 Tax=Xiamenia xianingshaonis TaxID=2682776 RepID=A0A9E6SV20_9ACTN|nr:DEAD/DEAH box helicase [Xiamenia xianingshaonis]NHM14320.1 DEAD/DEAH box helicase [Xiamenia xianingshaonis]QTU84802.1 DEAD/DEAH box helicase [Xiamenia xianingshaonis]
MESFDTLGLSPRLLKAVGRLGYVTPTPVQAQAIPLVLDGRDVIAAAKTGTGKTAAFSLPALDRIPPRKGSHGPLVLAVTPTRELAQQIGEVCEAIAEETHHRVLTVVGGVSIGPQEKALARGIDVLVATPGRLLDLMNQKAVSLASVEILVLDEADRMLDMGFWPSVKRIVAQTPASRQTLLFSATIDGSIERTVGATLKDPAQVEIAHRGETADTVDQYLVRVPQNVKPDLLKAVLAARGAERVIVFARTRSRADSTCRRLKRAGFAAEAIHSDRSQNQRRRALDNFAAGRTDILVATDVLARGIDVEGVSYVVNYDLPMQPEDYIHRIGRTGRAGSRGFSVSFVTPETEPMLRDIEKLTKRTLVEMELPGFDMEAAIRAAEARTQQHAAQRDPEIQQAKREVAKRAKAKAKARERAQGERGAAAGRTSGRTKLQGAAGSAEQQRQKGRGAGKPGRQNGAGSPGRTPASAQKKPQKPASRGAAGKSDMRPGRSHRAAVASQRNRPQSRGRR